MLISLCIVQNLEQRNKLNIAEIKTRLNNFSFREYIEFLSKKLVVTYNDGDCYSIFVYVEHTIWLLVLIGSVFCFIRNNYQKEIIIIYITLIGLTVFQLLFETRTRYLYTNVPLYIIAFVIGINNIMYLIKKKSTI